MSVDMWVNVSASVLATLACAVFVATYHVKAAWWRSEVGRNLVGFAAAVGALCLYTVLVTVWPTGCVAVVLRALRTLVLLAVGLLMVQRTRLLLRAQRESRDRTGV
ncbi:putative phage holin [Streptomyces reticuli]|uniref:putative phage holin n=1 Tax=Streptomyces reticuli TaxID=1926 RepID=UPI0007435538|nr:hypothetical protein [Streptomyces sp. SID7810]